MSTSLSTSWDDFRLIKAIGDTRSLVGAADELKINHSTVFRRLGQLEDALGAKLFERSRNGYAPTPAGEEMIEIADRMANDIVDFERKVAGLDIKPAGDLRVTTSDSMIHSMLTPIFASFIKACPDVRLEVIIDNRALNLSKRDADVAIRATSAPPETLVGRRISPIAWATYANHAQAASVDLTDKATRWIGYSDNLAALALSKSPEGGRIPGQVVYRLNTVLGVAEAIAAGIGVGFLPCSIADQHTKLKRLTPPIIDETDSLWLLTHPDLRTSARVRAFMDHVGKELMKKRKAFMGEI